MLGGRFLSPAYFRFRISALCAYIRLDCNISLLGKPLHQQHLPFSNRNGIESPNPIPLLRIWLNCVAGRHLCLLILQRGKKVIAAVWCR